MRDARVTASPRPARPRGVAAGTLAGRSRRSRGGRGRRARRAGHHRDRRAPVRRGARRVEARARDRARPRRGALLHGRGLRGAAPARPRRALPREGTGEGARGPGDRLPARPRVLRPAAIRPGAAAPRGGLQDHTRARRPRLLRRLPALSRQGLPGRAGGVPGRPRERSGGPAAHALLLGSRPRRPRPAHAGGGRGRAGPAPGAGLGGDRPRRAAARHDRGGARDGAAPVARRAPGLLLRRQRARGAERERPRAARGGPPEPAPPVHRRALRRPCGLRMVADGGLGVVPRLLVLHDVQQRSTAVQRPRSPRQRGPGPQALARIAPGPARPPVLLRVARPRGRRVPHAPHCGALRGGRRGRAPPDAGLRALPGQGLRRGLLAAAAAGGARRQQLHGGGSPPRALRAGPPPPEGRLPARLGPDRRAELRVRRPPAERGRPVHATVGRGAPEVRLRRAPARLPAQGLAPADVRARHAAPERRGVHARRARRAAAARALHARRGVPDVERAVEHRGVRLRPPRPLARPLLDVLSGATSSAQSLQNGRPQPPPPPPTPTPILLRLRPPGSSGTSTWIGGTGSVRGFTPCGVATEGSASATVVTIVLTARALAPSWPALTCSMSVCSPASACAWSLAVIASSVAGPEPAALR